MKLPPNFYSDDFCEIDFINHFGKLGELSLKHFDGDMESAANLLTENIVGTYDSIKEFLAEEIELNDEDEQKPFAKYIDFDDVYDDCFLNGDYIFFSADNKYYVYFK